MGNDEKILALVLQLKDEFTATMRKVEGSQEKFLAKQKQQASELDEYVGKVGQAMAGLFSVQAVRAWGSAVMEATSEIERMASKTGLSTQKIQELRYAADLTDTSFETLSGAYSRLAKNAAAAAEGQKGAVETFNKLGIEVTDSAGNLRSLDALMDDVSRAIRNTSSDTEKLAIAQAALGKSGGELIPMFDDLNAAQVEARESGAVWSEEALANIGALEESWKKLKTEANATAVEMTSPLWQDAADVIDALRANFDTLAQSVVNNIPGLRGALTWLQGYREIWQWMGEQAADGSVQYGPKAAGRTLPSSLATPAAPETGTGAEPDPYDPKAEGWTASAFGAFDDEAAPASGSGQDLDMLLYKMRKAATPSAALGADKAAAERKRQEEEQLRQEEADRKQLIIDLKRESYEGQLELAREAYDKEQRLLVGKHDMMTASEKRYNQSLNQLAQQRKANAAAVQGQLYSAMGGALSMFLGSQHALTKAAAVAEAVCNMNRGIALAAAYPPPLNAKVALAAKIQGATAIAGILATSFNSGGSGASGGGGGGTDLGTSATSSPVAASVGDLGQVATVVEPKERTAHDIQVHIHYAGTVVRENQLVDELVIPRLQQRIYDNVGLGA